MGYSIDQVKENMPKVGEEANGGIVDYVNVEHLWYRVMRRDGTNEAFKMPKAKRITGNNKKVNTRIKNPKTFPVLDI